MSIIDKIRHEIQLNGYCSVYTENDEIIGIEVTKPIHYTQLPYTMNEDIIEFFKVLE